MLVVGVTVVASITKLTALTASGWATGLAAAESGHSGKLQTVLQHSLPHRSGVYLLTLHLPPPSRSSAGASSKQSQQVESGLFC